MTKQSLALISFALLVCLTAHAAPKKKHASAPPEDVAPQEIDVDAMARAKDGKPTDATGRSTRLATRYGRTGRTRS